MTTQRQSLGGLIRAAMLSLFATAERDVHRLKKLRHTPQRHFQYPSRANVQSIAHYDAAIRAWMDSGREGPKPIRRVEPKKVRA